MPTSCPLALYPILLRARVLLALSNRCSYHRLRNDARAALLLALRLPQVYAVANAYLVPMLVDLPRAVLRVFTEVRLNVKLLGICLKYPTAIFSNLCHGQYLIPQRA